MAITWGAAQRKLQVGIDVIMSPGSVGAGTTSVTVTVNYYVRAQEAYADDQTLHYNGSLSGSWGYRLNASNGTTTDLHVGSRSFTVGTSYGGGPTYTFGAYLSGVYNGAAPSHSRSFTIPKRPASAPNAPSPVVSSVTATSAYLSANGNGNNGAAYSNIEYQTATNASFSGARTHSPGSWNGMTVTGLVRATTHWLRARAGNSAGWSGWSSAITFATKATVPDTMAAPTISDILPTEARATFAAPNNGGSAITRYETQVSTNTSYSGATTYTGSSPVALTGLDPGQKHFARVRAVNAIGAGAWSSSREFTTLSGSAVKVDGIWRSAKTYVKVDGTWRLAKVHKKQAGAWVL